MNTSRCVLNRIVFAGIIVLIIWCGVSIANERQIGSGTTVDVHLPIEPYYGYTYSQSIFLKSAINVNDQILITSISFNFNGYSEFQDDIVVYMGNTSKSSFSSGSDWIAVSNLQAVYSGTYHVKAYDGWYEIQLQQPFVYDNINNLVIAVDENTPGYHNWSDNFYCTYQGAGNYRSLYYYSDNTNPNPASPPGGERSAYCPNIKVEYATRAGSGTYSNCKINNVRIENSATQSAAILFEEESTGLSRFSYIQSPDCNHVNTCISLAIFAQEQGKYLSQVFVNAAYCITKMYVIDN